MKILYTKQFKEALSHPWNNISLGKIKLREGTDTGLTRQNMSRIMKFPTDFSETKATDKYYDTDIIKLPEGGIQISLEIPEEDQSFYDENYLYQVIMFFYTDLLTGLDSLAFICYGDIDYLSQGTEQPNNPVVFRNLKLTSRKNIITIPNFSWSCDLNFSQSEITKFIESPTGNLKVLPISSEEGGYISKKSWETWVIDSLSEMTLTPWIETTYINKYGIKIY